MGRLRRACLAWSATIASSQADGVPRSASNWGHLRQARARAPPGRRRPSGASRAARRAIAGRCGRTKSAKPLGSVGRVCRARRNGGHDVHTTSTPRRDRSVGGATVPLRTRRLSGILGRHRPRRECAGNEQPASADRLREQELHGGLMLPLLPAQSDRSRASTSSCSRPLVASTVPEWIVRWPSRSVNRPPASSMMTSGAARSQL